MRLSPTLDIEIEAGGARVIACARCGHRLGPATEPWKPRATLRERPMEELGSVHFSGGPVLLREFSCPGCATLLDTETAQEGDPFLDDFLLE